MKEIKLVVFAETSKEKYEYKYSAKLVKENKIVTTIHEENNNTRFCNSILDILLEQEDKIVLEKHGHFHSDDDKIIEKLVEIYNKQSSNTAS